MVGKRTRTNARRSLGGVAVVFVAAGAMACLAAMPGCGGDAKQVKAPTAAGSASATPKAASTVPSTTEVPAQRADVAGAAKDAYDRGWSAWMAGDLAGAKAAFTEASQKEPKAAAPHQSLGAVLEHLGDPTGAQQEYRTAFSVQPDYESAMGAYALSLANNGRGGEAETFLKDRRSKAPSSARLTTYLAEVMSLQKDSGAAQQLAQEALRQDADYREAMVVIARDHYRNRRMELARYAIQAILDGFGTTMPARDKENAEANLLRGLIEREAGHRAVAMAAFETARARRPDLVEALVNLGVMKLEAGNAREALPLLEAAVRYSPKSSQAHLNLGDAYRLVGRAAESKREFEAALTLDSSLATAHYNLGLLYLFSPQLPATTPADQVATAIRELETYKTMRGPKPPVGVQDDIDELLNRAKAKQQDLKLQTQGAAAATTPAATPAATASSAPKAVTAPAASVAPAASAAPKAATSAAPASSK